MVRSHLFEGLIVTSNAMLTCRCSILRGPLHSVDLLILPLFNTLWSAVRIKSAVLAVQVIDSIARNRPGMHCIAEPPHTRKWSSGMISGSRFPRPSHEDRSEASAPPRAALDSGALLPPGVRASSCRRAGPGLPVPAESPRASTRRAVGASRQPVAASVGPGDSETWLRDLR